jgi:HemY protein
MVKTLFIYLAVFLIAILFGLLISAHTAYVLLVVKNWQIILPLWFVIISLFLLFLIMFWLLGFLNFVKNLPSRYRYFYQTRTRQKRLTKFKEAIFLSIQNQFSSAEKIFLSLANKSDMPIVCYIFAIMMAKKRKEYALQQDYLYLASRYMNASDEFVVSLLQAKLCVQSKKYDAALMILDRLSQLKKYHPTVLALLKTIYEEKNDWEKLEKLLPKLRHTKAFSKEYLSAITKKMYRHTIANQKNYQSTQKIWRTLPSALRQDEVILKEHAKNLLHTKHDDEAAILISKYLNKQWSDSLVQLFGRCKTRTLAKQLAEGEKWLTTKPHSLSLLLSLGRIAVNFKYWAKAEEYLLKSLSFKKTALAHQLLGYVYENKGDREKAFEIYRQGYLLLDKSI